jgi:hypothetical protein
MNYYLCLQTGSANFSETKTLCYLRFCVFSFRLPELTFIFSFKNTENQIKLFKSLEIKPEEGVEKNISISKSEPKV